MSAVATLPTSIRSGFGKTSIPRMTVRITTSASAAPPSRVTSRRLSGTTGSIAWFSIGRPSGSVPARVVGHEIGCGEGLRDERGDLLAVGAAARPRREPAHDLAQVAGRRRAGRGDGLVDERLDLGLGRAARGRYSERIAISASSFAARSSRPPLRNASTDSRRVFTSRARTAA